MTQISDAKKGILTEEMKHVAKIENVSEDFILKTVAEGTIVIPSNVNRDIEASGIGAGLRTKVNATVGTSTDIVDFDEEVHKAQIAIDNGAALIFDNGKYSCINGNDGGEVYFFDSKNSFEKSLFSDRKQHI